MNELLCINPLHTRYVKVVFSWKVIIVRLKSIFLDYRFLTSQWQLAARTYWAAVSSDAAIEAGGGGEAGLQTGQTDWTDCLRTRRGTRLAIRLLSHFYSPGRWNSAALLIRPFMTHTLCRPTPPPPVKQIWMHFKSLHFSFISSVTFSRPLFWHFWDPGTTQNLLVTVSTSFLVKQATGIMHMCECACQMCIMWMHTLMQTLTITLTMILNLTLTLNLPITCAYNLSNIYPHFTRSTTASAHPHFTGGRWN